MDKRRMKHLYPVVANCRRSIFALLTVALLVISWDSNAQQNSDITARSAPQTSEPSQIQLPITVTTRDGRYVGGLSQNNFAIFNHKSPLEITSFSSTAVPAHIAILYDISGSQSVVSERDQTPLTGMFKKAISQFLGLNGSMDEYSLIAFNSVSNVLVEATHDGEALANTLGSLNAKGQTALLDACYMAIEKINRTAYQKRVLIIITDGQDNVSKHQDSELLRLLKRSNAVVYTVNFSGDADWRFPPLVSDFVPQLTEVSGGTAFYARNAAQLNAVFQQISIELKNQYVIGIKEDVGMSKSYKLKIKVTPPPNSPSKLRHLLVRGRKEYSYF
jgi:Ca-activated chloride channel family protein